MPKDKIKVKGKIKTLLQTKKPTGAGWKLNPKTGYYERRSSSENMVVLAGLTMMAKSIQYGHADQGKSLRYMGVGSGYTAPAKADTALVTEEDRQEIDSWDNDDIASDPVVMIASRLYLSSEANADLMEVGLFVNSSGPPMFCRGFFGNGSITGATQASPCVITASGHGLSDGDKIYIESVGGMTELNDSSYYIDDLDGVTFGLYSDSSLSTPVTSSGYGAYTSGGTWKQVIPKTSSTTLTVTYSLSFPAD